MKPILAILIMSSVFILFETPVSASWSQKFKLTQQDTSVVEQPQTGMQESFDPFGLFIKAVGILFILSFLLYFALKAYRNKFNLNTKSGSGPEIQVIKSVYLAPKKSISIVKALDHILLLGVSDNQISLLLKIPLENLNDNLRTSLMPQSKNSDPDFREFLKNWMKK